MLLSGLLLLHPLLVLACSQCTLDICIPLFSDCQENLEKLSSNAVSVLYRADDQSLESPIGSPALQISLAEVHTRIRMIMCSNVPPVSLLRPSLGIARLLLLSDVARHPFGPSLAIKSLPARSCMPCSPSRTPRSLFLGLRPFFRPFSFLVVLPFLSFLVTTRCSTSEVSPLFSTPWLSPTS